MSQETEIKVPSEEHPAPARAARPWLVTAIGLLLLLQTTVLLGLGAYNLILAGLAPGEFTVRMLRSFEGAVLALLAPLTLLAAVGFLTGQRSAWLLAILSQGLGLTISLLLYARERPVYVYVVMAYHVVMVMYLNSYNVRASFRPQPRTDNWEER